MLDLTRKSPRVQQGSMNTSYSPPTPLHRKFGAIILPAGNAKTQ